MVCITDQNIKLKNWTVVFTVKGVTFAYGWKIFASAFFSLTQNKFGRKLFSNNKTQKLKPSMF